MVSGTATVVHSEEPKDVHMKEIYADFNDFDENGNLALTCARSVQSIDRQKEPLQDGEEVCFSDGEVRAIGRVFKRNDGTWEGRGDWKFSDDVPPSSR
jgi:hypothetical protein